MQLKLIKILLKVLKFRPKLYHLIMIFAPLVVLFRFNHLTHFSEITYFDLPPFSLGKTAYAEPPAPPSKQTDPSNNKSSDASSPLSKDFDPLTLDENQVKVLQALAEEKSQKNTDGDMEKLKKLVELGQQKISEQVNKLEKLKSDLEKKKGNLTKEEIQNISQTAKIYENMKAADAAEIFNKLELIVLVQIIKHMNPKKAAVIMSKMEPKKSRYLTIELLRVDQIGAP